MIAKTYKVVEGPEKDSPKGKLFWFCNIIFINKKVDLYKLIFYYYLYYILILYININYTYKYTWKWGLYSYYHMKKR